MYNLNQWTTYKHTHRSFNLQETVDPSIVQGLSQLATEILGSDARAVFIQDKSLIEGIYNYSELPSNDQFKFEEFRSRKNSQLLAPLLIMVEIVNQANKRTMIVKAGEFYSKAGHYVIERGWQTGFCICFEHEPVEKILFERGYLLHNRYTGPIPMFCIGHHDQTVPWNFQRRDLNRMVGTYDKDIPASTYITVT